MRLSTGCTRQRLGSRSANVDSTRRGSKLVVRRPGAPFERLEGKGPTTMKDRQPADSKFVQITASVHGGEILLYALDEAGDVWRFDDKTRQWVRLPRDRR
jgi:hypothetical protein